MLREFQEKILSSLSRDEAGITRNGDEYETPAETEVEIEEAIASLQERPTQPPKTEAAGPSARPVYTEKERRAAAEAAIATRNRKASVATVDGEGATLLNPGESSQPATTLPLPQGEATGEIRKAKSLDDEDLLTPEEYANPLLIPEVKTLHETVKFDIPKLRDITERQSRRAQLRKIALDQIKSTFSKQPAMTEVEADGRAVVHRVCTVSKPDASELRNVEFLTWWLCENHVFEREKMENGKKVIGEDGSPVMEQFKFTRVWIQDDGRREVLGRKKEYGLYITWVENQ